MFEISPEERYSKKKKKTGSLEEEEEAEEKKHLGALCTYVQCTPSENEPRLCLSSITSLERIYTTRSC